MTEEQATRILAYLQAAYPRDRIPDQTVSVYVDALRTLESNQVLRAAQAHVATEKFFPSIAELIRPVAEAQVGMCRAEEAWIDVTRAISRWGRYTPWTFENPLIGRAVDAIGRDEICNSENLAVERAHFMRIYASYRDTELTAAKVAPVSGRTYRPLLPSGGRSGQESAGAAVARLIAAKKGGAE